MLSSPSPLLALPSSRNAPHNPGAGNSKNSPDWKGDRGKKSKDQGNKGTDDGSGGGHSGGQNGGESDIPSTEGPLTSEPPINQSPRFVKFPRDKQLVITSQSPSPQPSVPISQSVPPPVVGLPSNKPATTTANSGPSTVTTTAPQITKLIASSSLSSPSGTLINTTPVGAGLTTHSSIPPISDTGEHSHHTPSIGTIVGGVIGGLALFALLAGLGLFCYQRHRNRLAPSTDHRTAIDRCSWLQINDPVDDSHGVFRPDLKHNNTDQYSNIRDTDAEAAFRRKAEILEDLKFEAAVRDGVKA